MNEAENGSPNQLLFKKGRSYITHSHNLSEINR